MNKNLKSAFSSELLCQEIDSVLKDIMKDILVYGELSIPDSKFVVFRKLVLDAFGHDLQVKLRNAIGKVLDRAGANANLKQGGGEP